MGSKRGTLAERFSWKLPTDRDPAQCWPWQGAQDGHGYGQINSGGANGRPLKAHRVSYEVHVGPIPEGLSLDHLCRNPICVNPAHLEPVTHRENMRRGMSNSHVTVRTGICQRGHVLPGGPGSGRCKECRLIPIQCPDCGESMRRTSIYKHRDRACKGSTQGVPA